MGNPELPGLLVDCDWLREHLQDPDLILFDASWHMPASGRDGRAEWLRKRIPGARFFDFDGRIRAPDTELPHMLPDAALFTREVQALGLNGNSRVVIYDSLGMFSAPRAWWMLKAMGFTRTAILDGGLPDWEASGLAFDSGEPDPVQPGDFEAEANPAAVVDAQAVLAALQDEAVCVLDARPAARFSGAAEEPRPGLRRGHMPGARNLPFGELFEDGLLKSKDDLRALFAPFIEDKSRTLCSCGSGVTASILVFAAQYAGYENLAVYDGSWSEWGLPGEWPVVTDVPAAD